MQGLNISRMRNVTDSKNFIVFKKGVIAYGIKNSKKRHFFLEHGTPSDKAFFCEKMFTMH